MQTEAFKPQFEFSPADCVTLQPAQYASKTLKSRAYVNFTIGSLVSET